MSQQVGSNATVTCTVCFDEDIDSAHTIENDPVCHDCVKTEIVPQFEAAIEHEHQYPVRWGDVALQVTDFAYVLGDDFVRRYRRRELEYQTPVANRIYCQHKLRAASAPAKGAPAPRGAPLALSQDEIDGLELFGADLVECGAMVSGRVQRSNTKLICYHCHGDVCACEQPLRSPTEVHNCEAKRKTGLDLEAEGQVRGKDFQLCPSCKIPIGLRDGCNAMTCEPCRTQFCFICGEIAHHNSDHWKLGSSCPRWGQPGPRALFDGGAPNAPNAANAALPIPDLRARLLAIDLIRMFGDELAAGADPDDDWVRHQANNIRGVHGELVWAVMLEEMRAMNAQMAEQDRLQAMLREVQAWAPNQAVAGAVNPGLAEAADIVVLRGRLDPEAEANRVVDLAIVPIDILFNIQAMQQNLVFDARWNPLNEAARTFVERHTRIVRAIDAVGDREFRERLPLLRQVWEDYINRVPAGLTEALRREPR